jgi:hypothetical protein
MKDSRQLLIADLAADLRPVRRAGQVALPLFGWLSIAGLYSVGAVVATGPFRGQAFAALASSPAYAAEMLVAIAVIGAFAHAALRAVIPDGGSWPLRLAAPLFALGAWLVLLLWGLMADPALSASMADRRSHCFWESIIVSIPSFALLLWFARGFLPLWPRATAALAGAAAAAIPALLMQFACMYEPVHAMTHHLTPIGVLAAAGLLIGPKVLSRRAVVPRRRDAAIH